MIHVFVVLAHEDGRSWVLRSFINRQDADRYADKMAYDYEHASVTVHKTPLVGAGL